VSGDDNKRFAEVVMPHLGAAYSLAHWLTGDAADAEDVVQEACVRAFRAVGGYSGGNARAWTLTIVRNTAFSWLAKNRRRTLVAVDDLEAVERAQALPGRNGAQANPATPETELIDTQHHTIRNLAARYGLPLDDLHAAEPRKSDEVYRFGGQYYPKTQATADFLAMFDALQADVDAAPFPTQFNSFTAAGFALDHMSVFDWIESRVPGGHRAPLGQLLDVAYNIEYGAESSEQSALNIVYLLGFLPGFAYMGIVDERIATPRLSKPRMQVPAGSVGIAGNQTGIYPLDSPGGWNIIGQTPLQMFDVNREDPCLLKPGDKIQFKSIGLDEFNKLTTA